MVTMFTLLVTGEKINYTITSTFSDDGFVTDAKTTPTLFESLQKMTEDCTEGLLPVPFLSSMYFI